MANSNFRRNFVSILAVAMIIFFSSQAALADDPPAEQPTPRNIHLEIIAFDATLFDADINVIACENAPSSSVFTINGWCAISAAATQASWSVTSTWGQYGVFLQSINQYDGADGNYWLWYSDLQGGEAVFEPGGTALNLHELENGESMLLTYGISPMKLSTGTNFPFINTSSTIQALFFNPMAWGWAPVASTTIFEINGQDFVDEDGIYDLWTNTTTPYSILAKKDRYLTSESVAIAPQLPTTTINLQIVASTSTFYAGQLTVFGCENSLGSGIYSVNGYCAVEQAGTTNSWSWYGNDVLLNSINGIANDYASNIYWGWFSELQYGQTAINKHQLIENENLLLTHNIKPLQIFPITSTPEINTTTTISIKESDFDASWTQIWSESSSSTIVINGQDYFSADGEYQLFISTTTPYSIYGKKDGYITSSVITVIGYESPTVETAEIPAPPVVGGGGGGGYSISHNKIDISKAASFLSSLQNPDGSFDSAIYTDWAAVAFSSLTDENEAKNKIKNYLLTDPPVAGGLNPTSDYARRAMAMMALNIDPYSGVAINYIKKITDAFDGKQIGDPDLVNDDIFALFPLLKAGYSVSDPIVTGTIKFIIENQNSNGSWGSVDLTAAAIQALLLAPSMDGVSGAINNARTYLHFAQSDDGGFGNSFSTSWVLQAVASIGESESNWTKNNKTPNDYLYSQQQNDGGIENFSAPTSTRLWATSYAIPAVAGKSWNQLLNNFSKPSADVAAGNSGGGVGGYPLEIPASLLVYPTSTSPTTSIVSVAAPSTVSEKISINVTGKKNPAGGDENIKSVSISSPSTENNNQQTTDEPRLLTLSQANAPDNKENVEKIVNQLPLNASTRRTAKRIMVVSGGSAVAVGLYLGLKFLKNIV